MGHVTILNPPSFVCHGGQSVALCGLINEPSSLLSGDVPIAGGVLLVKPRSVRFLGGAGQKNRGEVEKGGLPVDAGLSRPLLCLHES